MLRTENILIETGTVNSDVILPTNAYFLKDENYKKIKKFSQSKADYMLN